jgi:hypothetical protein
MTSKQKTDQTTEQWITLCVEDKDLVSAAKALTGAGVFFIPPCGMIFEFPEMAKAEAFVGEVKKRYGLDGIAFDDIEAAEAHHVFPFRQEPPVAHIERVWADSEAEVEELTKRFGLTPKMLERPPGWPDISLEGRASSAAESLVEELAETFGGKFVGT